MPSGLPTSWQACSTGSASPCARNSSRRRRLRCVSTDPMASYAAASRAASLLRLVCCSRMYSSAIASFLPMNSHSQSTWWKTSRPGQNRAVPTTSPRSIGRMPTSAPNSSLIGWIHECGVSGNGASRRVKRGVAMSSKSMLPLPTARSRRRRRPRSPCVVSSSTRSSGLERHARRCASGARWRISALLTTRRSRCRPGRRAPALRGRPPPVSLKLRAGSCGGVVPWRGTARNPEPMPYLRRSNPNISLPGAGCRESAIACRPARPFRARP